MIKHGLVWAGVLLVLLYVQSRAGVMPYVKYLYPAGSTPTWSVVSVPSGKAVVFDHMQSTARTVTVQMNYNTSGSGIDSTVGLLVITITNPTPGYITALPAPLRLYAGWSVTNWSSSSIYLFGLAMDADDLYAGVGNEIDTLGLAAGTWAGGVQVDSPRPVVATVETSGDLKNWSVDEGINVQRGVEPDRLEFQAPSGDPDTFYRVRTRATR